MSSQIIKQAIKNFNQRAEMKNAEALVQLTFEQLGYPHLMDHTEILFNNRYVNVAGTALVRNLDTPYGKKPKGKIELSTKFFSIASEDEKIETVVHEACHIVNEYLIKVIKNPYDSKHYNKTKGHDSGWSNLMDKAGYKNANIYHCINTSVFKSFYNYDCICGKKIRVTAQMGGRIKNRTSYRVCRTCKSPINPYKLVKVSGADI